MIMFSIAESEYSLNGLMRMKINSVSTMNFLLEASFIKVIVCIECERFLINPVLLGLNHYTPTF